MDTENVVLLLYILKGLAFVIAVLLLPVILYYVNSEKKRISKLETEITKLKDSTMPSFQAYSLIIKSINKVYGKTNFSIVLNSFTSTNMKELYSYTVLYLGVPIETRTFEIFNDSVYNGLIKVLSDTPERIIKDTYKLVVDQQNSSIKNDS